MVIFRVASVVFLVAALGLILGLSGSLFFGWEDAPVPGMAVLMTISALAVIGVRAALHWSIKLDARGIG